MEDKITYQTLFNLSQNRGQWFKHEIYATTKAEFPMKVWNGSHSDPMENNFKTHVCPIGTKVRVWMVSRFGDAGITDNLINPKGYDCRGVDVDSELENIEIIKLNP